MEEFLKKLEKNLNRIDFSDVSTIYVGFPETWEVESLINNKNFIFEGIRDTQMQIKVYPNDKDNNRIYKLYKLSFQNIAHTTNALFLLTKLLENYLEKEKLINDFNIRMEEERRKLEEAISLKININSDDLYPTFMKTTIDAMQTSFNSPELKSIDEFEEFPQSPKVEIGYDDSDWDEEKSEENKNVEETDIGIVKPLSQSLPNLDAETKIEISNTLEPYL